MTGLVDAQEQAVLDGMFQDPSFAGFATLWVGLSSTTPTDAGGNITEPTTGSYARVATVAADWGAATGAAPVTKSNANVVTFPTATADWLAGVNLTHFVLFDAATLGNAVNTGVLTTPKPVLTDDTAEFGVGDLVMRLGDPVDFP